MTEEEVKQLEGVLIKVLHHSRRIPEQQHYEDHTWTKRQRAREERLDKYKEKFWQTLVGALAVSGLIVLTWIGSLIIEAIRNGNLPGGH